MNTNKPRLLVFGASGQVGRAIRKLAANEFEAFFTLRAPNNSNDIACDISQTEQIQSVINAIKPLVIINCAAYTAVDLAEKEADLAQIINAKAVEDIAVAANSIDAILIHYSTDYVFDGKGDHPWKESDSTCPINTYGHSKLSGEHAVSKHCPQHGYIFRTQWVYDNEGKNFLNTMLRLGVERETLSVVGDQVGSPTSSDVIAKYTLKAIRKIMQHSLPAGIYNLACSGETSWHGFASRIFEFSRQHGATLKVNKINKISSLDYPTPAQRPKNSRLDLSKLRLALSEDLPSWEDALKEVLHERFHQKT